MAKRTLSIVLALVMILGVFSVFSADAAIKILTTKTIKVGQTADVRLTDPNTGAKLNTLWESSNPDIATVTSSGTVTAKKAGTCTLSTWWNSKLYGVKVIVKAAAKKKIVLSKKSASLTVGKKLTLKLKNAKSSKVKWTSSNKKVAAVTKKGVVKAKKKGKATITAKYRGKKYKCKITVKKKSGMTIAKAFNKVKKFVQKNGKQYGETEYSCKLGTKSNFLYNLMYYSDSNCLAYYAAYKNQGIALYVFNNKKAKSCFYEYGSSGGYKKLHYTEEFIKATYKYKTTKLTYKSATKSDNNMAIGMLSWAIGDFDSYTKKKAGVTMKQLGFTNWDK
ncbi:MAG: Ig-like domain-containing protein [Ruminococcus sp.]|nr:Ig-like domain-containing protein [Ruminococcus sp.]